MPRVGNKCPSGQVRLLSTDRHHSTRWPLASLLTDRQSSNGQSINIRLSVSIVSTDIEVQYRSNHEH